MDTGSAQKVGTRNGKSTLNHLSVTPEVGKPGFGKVSNRNTPQCLQGDGNAAGSSGRCPCSSNPAHSNPDHSRIPACSEGSCLTPGAPMRRTHSGRTNIIPSRTIPQGGKSTWISSHISMHFKSPNFCGYSQPPNPTFLPQNPNSANPRRALKPWRRSLRWLRLHTCRYPREISALPRFPPPNQRVQTPLGAALCHSGTSSRSFGPTPSLSWLQGKDHKDDSLIFRAWWYPEDPEWSFHLESSDCPTLECCRSLGRAFPELCNPRVPAIKSLLQAKTGTWRRRSKEFLHL